MRVRKDCICHSHCPVWLSPLDQMHTGSQGEGLEVNSEWSSSLNLYEILGNQGSPDLVSHPRLSSKGGGGFPQLWGRGGLPGLNTWKAQNWQSKNAQPFKVGCVHLMAGTYVQMGAPRDSMARSGSVVNAKPSSLVCIHRWWKPHRCLSTRVPRMICLLAVTMVDIYWACINI